MIDRITQLVIPFLLAVAFMPMACCHQDSYTRTQMDLADSLMETAPDSALAILDGISPSDIKGKEESARYALLRSMALDKNYIDTTTFDVLQPAIDFYFKHGTPNEKLRTYYYQGRIYQNQGKEDLAMMCFMKSSDLRNEITDSLVLARNFVSLASLYYLQYKTDDFIKNNIYAARIYHAYKKNELEIDCYARALIGKILLGDRDGADSLMSVCTNLLKQHNDGQEIFFPSYMSYVIEYGTPEEIKSFLTEYQDRELSLENNINLARGYSKIGEHEHALDILSQLDFHGTILDSLKYTAAKALIFERQGNFEQAFNAYKEYTVMEEFYSKKLMNQDLLFLDKRHLLEMANLKAIQSRNRILWTVVCAFLVVVILSGWLYYRYRLICSKRIIAEMNLERLEADKCQRELEAENLKLEKFRLEDERDRLRILLGKHDELARPVRDVMKMRHDMLNSILSKDITNNENYAKPYNKWIESIRSDKDEFMNSTRLAFKASHPHFIDYLEQKNLTTDEINYLCLYAIGLRGKDVGEYIQLKRHYNISSELRRKLGLNGHDTNLGNYIRRLMNEL